MIRTVALSISVVSAMLLDTGAVWGQDYPAKVQKTPYDLAKDFAPISLIAREVSVLVVHPSLPVKSVTDLINLAKAKPGQLNYGASVTGSPAHLGGEFYIERKTSW